MKTQSFDFEGPVGRLEAILMTPTEPPRAAAVLCHAHPLHGGMMHFKVLFRAAKAFQKAGFAVLRFNFRGVGRSEGAHDHGRGERADVRAALDELERRYPGLPVALGGFSFGSVMALVVGVKDSRVRALLAMGFPLTEMTRLDFLVACDKPRLFVQGEKDRFGGGPVLEDFVLTLPEPRRLTVIPGADHFFSDQLEALEAAVSAWLQTKPWLGGRSPDE